MRRENYKSGFTLLEVMITIAIVGILAAIAVLAYWQYLIRAGTAELISLHEEVRITVNSAGNATESCSDVISAVPPAFLKSKYAELDVDFKAVSNGYIPFYRVCAEAATHGKFGIRVCKAAYDTFMREGLILSGQNTFLGESIAAYSVSLVSGDAPICTTYTSISASGSGCAGAVSVKPVTPPSKQVVAKPPLQTQQPPQTTTPTPPPVDRDKNIKAEHRTYQRCAGPPEACEVAVYEDECPESAPFALNKVTNLADGTKLVERKCATREECYNEWWLGCSDDDKCRNFDPNSFYTYYFECSFCCTGNNCNSDLKPSKNSLVNFSLGKDTPTNTAWEKEKQP